MDGKTLAQSTIKIVKTPTKVKISSIKGKPGTKKYVTATVYDKSDGLKHWGGKVTFKINGKTYKVKVKDGVAKLKIKLPSKEKTYNCKAIFSGDKNSKGSSKTFTLTVKKASTTKKKKTISFTVTAPVKFDKYSSKKVGKYTFRTIKYVEYNSNGRYYGVATTILKNNKPIAKSKYTSTYWWHFKSGVWKYFSKNRSVTYDDVSKVDKIKVKITIK